MVKEFTKALFLISILLMSVVNSQFLSISQSHLERSAENTEDAGSLLNGEDSIAIFSNAFTCPEPVIKSFLSTQHSKLPREGYLNSLYRPPLG